MDCCFKIVFFKIPNVQKRLPRCGLSLKENSHVVKGTAKKRWHIHSSHQLSKALNLHSANTSWHSHVMGYFHLILRLLRLFFMFLRHFASA